MNRIQKCVDLIFDTTNELSQKIDELEEAIKDRDRRIEELNDEIFELKYPKK